MKIASRAMCFGMVGLAFTLAVAGLASLAPSLFGWLTLPLWILPGVVALGAHDVGWPLMLISGTTFYGLAAFLLFSVLQGRRRRGGDSASAKNTSKIIP